MSLETVRLLQSFWAPSWLEPLCYHRNTSWSLAALADVAYYNGFTGWQCLNYLFGSLKTAIPIHSSVHKNVSQAACLCARILHFENIPQQQTDDSYPAFLRAKSLGWFHAYWGGHWEEVSWLAKGHHAWEALFRLGRWVLRFLPCVALSHLHWVIKFFICSHHRNLVLFCDVEYHLVDTTY